MIAPHHAIIGAAAALAVGMPVLLLRTSVPPPALPPYAAPTPLAPIRSPAMSPPLLANLFSPTRLVETLPDPQLASATGAPGAPGAPPAQPAPKLVGIAVQARGRAAALLKAASGETSVVGVGGEVDGWRVTAIGSDTVALTRGGEQQRAALDFGNRGGAVPTPNATPASSALPAPRANTTAVMPPFPDTRQ